jgi:hypothetical protein
MVQLGVQWSKLNDASRRQRLTRCKGGGGVQTSKNKTRTTTTQHHNLLKDFKVGSNAVRKQYGSTWWSWDAGSTLNFWRWPEGEQRLAARDGMPAHIQGTLPKYFLRAKQPSPESYGLLVTKLKKMLERGYVSSTLDEKTIESLVDYFFVPKADDIQPIYNGTSCGLNASVWAPNFWLPTGQSATDILNYEYSIWEKCSTTFPSLISFELAQDWI